ncbi:MAG: SOS response-associated peptidase family protein [Sphingomonas sp.]
MANTMTHADQIGQPGAMIRRTQGGRTEMINLIWGLEPAWLDERPFEVVRAEGRSFAANRCRLPASEFFHYHRGDRYRSTRVDGDGFYLAGIWRASTPRWPSDYAALTIAANEDVERCAERQMRCPARAPSRLARHPCPEAGILAALPAHSFRAERCDGDAPRQADLALGASR